MSGLCSFATFVAGFVTAQLAKAASGSAKLTTVAEDFFFYKSVLTGYCWYCQLVLTER